MKQLCQQRRWWASKRIRTRQWLSNRGLAGSKKSITKTYSVQSWEFWNGWVGSHGGQSTHRFHLRKAASKSRGKTRLRAVNSLWGFPLLTECAKLVVALLFACSFYPITDQYKISTNVSHPSIPFQMSVPQSRAHPAAYRPGVFGRMIIVS